MFKAALLLGVAVSANARSVHNQHQHLHAKKDAPAEYAPSSAASDACECKTSTIYYYGEATLVSNPSKSDGSPEHAVPTTAVYGNSSTIVSLSSSATWASTVESAVDPVQPETTGEPEAPTVPGHAGKDEYTTEVVIKTENKTVFASTTICPESSSVVSPVAPEATPVEKPVEEKPVEEKPVEEKPAEEKPIEEKPIEKKPVEEKPVEEKPVEEKPIEKKPVEEKPVEKEAPIVPVATTSTKESIVETTKQAEPTKESAVETTKQAEPTKESAVETTKQAEPTTSSQKEKASPSSKPEGGKGGSAPHETNGNKWAMTYTPYDKDGECTSSDKIATDVADIASKGFTTVRIYATDCDGLEFVGKACKDNGLNMVVGIFIDEAGIGSNTKNQEDALMEWGSKGNWGMVEMVVVGNEAVFNGYCSASELASYIEEVKSKFTSAGSTAKFTTAETLDVIQANSDAICGAVDVISANIHPFFNKLLIASKAGEFVDSQLSDLSDCCNGEKEAFNLETGWPSQGLANGMALPGFGQQKSAVDSIMDVAGKRSCMFSYADDSWKTPGEWGVEQYWGVGDLF